MMRKDVRIGFAIGGVLLAVLIVYGLVTSGPNPRNNEVTLAPDDPGAAASTPNKNNGSAQRPGPANGANGAAAPQTGEPSGESEPGTSGTASRNGGNAPDGNGTLAAKPAPTTAPADKWEHALTTGALPSMMAKTETPSPNGAGAAPAPTDGATATPPPPQQANGSTEGAAGATGTGAGAVNPTNDTSAPAPNASAASGNTGGTFNAADLANMASVPPSNAAGGSGAAGATPATPGSPAPVPGQRTHVVQPNETFASIAEVAYGSQHYYPHIVRANPNVNPKRMRAGTTIVLPDRDQVVAKEPKAAETGAPTGTGAGSADGAAVGTSSSASGAQQAAAVLPPIDERTQYRVQPSESLYKISLKLYGRIDKVDAIYNLNKDLIGPNANRLKAGTVLKLPDPPTNLTAAR